MSGIGAFSHEPVHVIVTFQHLITEKNCSHMVNTNLLPLAGHSFVYFSQQHLQVSFPSDFSNVSSF